MKKITEIRLTLAGFLYGIETDLKNLIKRRIAPFYSDLSFFHDENLTKRVIARYQKDNQLIRIVLKS